MNVQRNKCAYKNAQWWFVIYFAGSVILMSTSCERRLPPKFEILKSIRTGIDFNPLLRSKSTDANAIKEFGCAVAVADIDQDSLPDLVFSSIYGTPEIYLNKGNFKFENITEKSGVRFPPCFVPYGAAAVDINNDGLQDLYFCSAGNNPVEGCNAHNLLFINNGDLTFTEQSSKYHLDIQANCYMPYFFDYDGDGDLDLFQLIWPDFQSNPLDISYMAIARRDTNSQHSLLLENDNGIFKDVTSSKGIEKFPATNNACIISDINQDGLPDIYVDNDFIFPDQLYINHGGFFKNELKDYMGKTTMFSMGIDCADLNNDLYPDLVEADMLSPSHYRRKLNTIPFTIGFYDLLYKKSFPQFQRNMIQLNNNGKNFSETGYMSGAFATEWSWSPLVADLDNDGLKDLFFSCGSRRELTNMDHMSNYSDSYGFFDPIKQWQFDWTNIPSYHYHNFVFKNTNGYQCSDMTTSWGIDKTTNSEGAAYADLDGDGYLDIIVCNTDEKPYVLKNNGHLLTPENKSIFFRLHSNLNGGYAPNTKIFLYTGAKSQYVEAINTKGFLSVSEDKIHFGVGTATYADSAKIVWPSGKVQTIFHIPANNTIDVYEKNALTGWHDGNSIYNYNLKGVNTVSKPFIHHEDNFNDFRRDKLIPHQLSRLGPAIGSCDLNKDGYDDVFVGAAHGYSDVIYTQNAKGSFDRNDLEVFAADSAFEDISVAFADIDNNGFPDIIIGSGSNADIEKGITQNLRIYLNYGNMKFKLMQNNLPRISEVISTVSPINIGGNIFIFAGGRVKSGEYGTIPSSYLLENHDGLFRDVTDLKAPDLRHIGMVTSSAFCDIDGDGKPELIVAGEFMPVSIFKRIADKWVNQTAKANLENTNGWWNCILPVDLNKDGHMDLLAGNWGLNTLFTASKTEPLELWVNDFDHNGSLDPVLFHFLQGVNAPFVGRDLFCKQMPAFFNKFNNYESYARCTGNDIFDNKALQGTQKFFAYTLCSVAFINNGKGQFAMEPLPPQVQQAPVNSFVADDFNNDGVIDFIPFGNTNANFFDQGDVDALRSRLFTGDGKGHFNPGHLPDALNRKDVVTHTCTVFDKALNKQVIFTGVNNDTMRTYIY